MSNSLSLTNRRSLRHTFGELSDTVNMPNLIAIQRSSYQQFLDSKVDTDKNLADLLAKCHTVATWKRLKQELDRIATKVSNAYSTGGTWD